MTNQLAKQGTDEIVAAVRKHYVLTFGKTDGGTKNLCRKKQTVESCGLMVGS